MEADRVNREGRKRRLFEALDKVRKAQQALETPFAEFEETGRDNEVRMVVDE